MPVSPSLRRSFVGVYFLVQWKRVTSKNTAEAYSWCDVGSAIFGGVRRRQTRPLVYFHVWTRKPQHWLGGAFFALGSGAPHIEKSAAWRKPTRLNGGRRCVVDPSCWATRIIREHRTRMMSATLIERVLYATHIRIEKVDM